MPIPVMKSTKRWQPRYTVLVLMWLVYGCFYLNKLNLAPVIPLIIDDLNISHARIGFISAFFFAFYSCSQFLWGYLSDVYGPRRIVTLGGGVSALANCFFSGGSGLFHLGGAQSLNGFGQGAGWGASVQLLNNWFGRSEKGRVLGIYATSVSIFTLSAYGLAAYIGNAFGWRAVFRVSPAVLGVALLIYWIFVRDYPPAAGKRKYPPGVSKSDVVHLPIRNRFAVIFSNKNYRLACVAFAGLTFISYTNLVWIPTFLHESYGLSLYKAGLLAGLYPAIGILARPLGGHLSDVTFGGLRKPLMLIGFFCILLSTLCLAAITDLGWVIFLIVSVGVFDQLVVTLFFAFLLDILPEEVTATGASTLNALGHVGSTSAVFCAGLLVDQFHSFRPVFLTLSFVACVGFVAVWLIQESRSSGHPNPGDNRAAGHV